MQLKLFNRQKAARWMDGWIDMLLGGQAGRQADTPVGRFNIWFKISNEMVQY